MGSVGSRHHMHCAFERAEGIRCTVHLNGGHVSCRLQPSELASFRLPWPQLLQHGVGCRHCRGAQVTSGAP